ncbi:HAD-IA family hydrolase [Streptomyces sp. 769]|uniref:HAD-IA family hydrolase n=1 Tax=Streptomyces sp. 769 TaxID=1262452 RepID=UPI000581D022|nr:HAD-IA family hydrolase [Streptomyces sp. 769]AJC54988.1 phosphatase [Streptomyces sp. 769]
MRFSANALLFDSDETLVSSMKSVFRCWAQWADTHGITVEEIIAVEPHGRPAAAIVADLLPADQVARALALLEQAEVDDAAAGGVAPIPGAKELLASLPADRWAVVTSGTRRVAEARLAAAGVHAAHVITVDDVTRHKPDPEPFLTAARRLGVAPAECVAFEDSPAGLAAARAAGMTTVALTTTHKAADLDADVVVPDLAAVSARTSDTGVHVTITVCEGNAEAQNTDERNGTGLRQ